MSLLVTFTILLTFWLLLSGHFDFLHVLLGVASSLFVAYVSQDALIGHTDIRSNVQKVGRFVSYLPWLFYQIVLANLDVVYRTLHHRMPIDPAILSFQTDLKTDFGMATLANSITLTPGTVTLDVHEGRFVVHVLSKEPAESLLRGVSQSLVERIEAD